jgi:hypothetical protein
MKVTERRMVEGKLPNEFCVRGFQMANVAYVAVVGLRHRDWAAVAFSCEVDRTPKGRFKDGMPGMVDTAALA